METVMEEEEEEKSPSSSVFGGATARRGDGRIVESPLAPRQAVERRRRRRVRDLTRRFEEQTMSRYKAAKKEKQRARGRFGQQSAKFG